MDFESIEKLNNEAIIQLYEDITVNNTDTKAHCWGYINKPRGCVMKAGCPDCIGDYICIIKEEIISDSYCYQLGGQIGVSGIHNDSYIGSSWKFYGFCAELRNNYCTQYGRQCFSNGDICR